MTMTIRRHNGLVETGPLATTRKIFFPPSFHYPWVMPTLGKYEGGQVFVAFGKNLDSKKNPVKVTDVILSDISLAPIPNVPTPTIYCEQSSGNWYALFKIPHELSLDLTSLYTIVVEDEGSSVDNTNHKCHTTPFLFSPKPTPIATQHPGPLNPGITGPAPQSEVPETFPAWGTSSCSSVTLTLTDPHKKKAVVPAVPVSDNIWVHEFTVNPGDDGIYTLVACDSSGNSAPVSISVSAEDSAGNETEDSPTD